MAIQTKPIPPTGDKRWKLVQAEMAKYGYGHQALIQALHAVQDAFGYLDRQAMEYVASALRLPLSRVFGVATFYHYFSMKPPGKHTCVICTGTACYIKGAPALIDAIKKEYNVSLGETTNDGELSVLNARCVGGCGLAPAVVVDGKVLGNITDDMLIKRIREVVER